MSDVPHYFLYGETAPSDALDFIYIASLEESLPKHNWEIHPHRHDNLHQLLVIEDGSAVVQVNDHSSRQTGHCVVSVPSKEVHGFMHERGVHGYIITIVDSYLHGIFAETERQNFPHVFNDSLIVPFEADSSMAWEMDMLIKRIVREYRQTRLGQNCVIGAYLKVLFVLLSRATKRNLSADKPYDAKISTYEKFQKVLELHYRNQWNTGQYAQELGMTSSRLNRLCQRFAGQNALQLIHDRVVTEAKRLLIYANVSVNEVAYELGFKDPAYFSRFFAKHAGEPPGRYKKRMKEQALV